MLNKTYYAFKFFIPRQLQIRLRRHIVKGKLSSYADIWPIDPTAAKRLGIRGLAPTSHEIEIGTDYPKCINWPDGKKFALVLTHDIENANGLEKCVQLAELEERLGFRSSFNFVARDYDVPVALRRYLTDRGFEIGIHGLYHRGNPFRSKSAFRKHSIQINRILKEWGAVGFRSPSMYHDLEMLHHLDIEYDTSTFDTDPFEPQPDGMGTIFPFWVPDRDGEKGYVELPYTLPQDFLLFILLQEKNIDTWKKKLDWIGEHGGMALFIAHPGYMSFNNTLNYEEYPARYYEEFLEYIRSRYEGRYWNALPRDISRYWASKYERKEIVTKSFTHKRKIIWIDLDNSPHVPFFKPIIDELHKRGYDTLITARNCFQVCGLADLLKVEYKQIGRHYGKNKLMKVAGLLIRSYQLMSPVFDGKPDLAVSHGSRSQVLTSTLQKIPTVVIADYEYTQTIAKPTYIVVPEMIPDRSIKGYTKAFFKYPGIKEDVYVPNFKPDPSILKELGIPQKELLVTIRPPATEAHYHNPESELLFEETLNFLCQQENVCMVILPRNEKKQTAWVKRNWSAFCDSRKIIIPEHVVDGLNLIWHSDLVISGGGTMNREAAALGVPVYSIFRGKIGAVDQYLSENGRLILLETAEDIHKKLHLHKRHQSDKLDNSQRKALATILGLIEKILKEVQ